MALCSNPNTGTMMAQVVGLNASGIYDVAARATPFRGSSEGGLHRCISMQSGESDKMGSHFSEEEEIVRVRVRVNNIIIIIICNQYSIHRCGYNSSPVTCTSNSIVWPTESCKLSTLWPHDAGTYIMSPPCCVHSTKSCDPSLRFQPNQGDTAEK
eukprot:COSAG01_NODE_4215_length_5231_cov_15.336906_3_plen_155_part_00